MGRDGVTLPHPGSARLGAPTFPLIECHLVVLPGHLLVLQARLEEEPVAELQRHKPVGGVDKLQFITDEHTSHRTSIVTNGLKVQS